MTRLDLIVIGGGTAGLVTAIGAASLGARVALVERDRTGGDCLWTGCVPSKSLIAAAQRAQDMRGADRVGLEPVEPRIDFARVMEHVRAAQAAIAPQDSEQRLRALGVEVITGQARFVGPRRIEVDGRRLAARAVLVATGSRPLLPPIDGLAALAPLTSDTLWQLEALPPRLAILGGGPIGCELGQAFARLGSRVTIVEAQAELLGREEPEARALIAARLSDEGVELRLAQTARRAERGGDGAGRLLLDGGHDGDEPWLEFDRLLVAVGRRPDTADLGLERAGVQLDERGAVGVDERLRTAACGIYAAGDVVGQAQLTHLAAHHARVVVANALLHTRRTVQTSAIPRATYTDPEVAAVGLTERDARERHGDAVRAVRFDYAELDRAITQGEAVGFAKLVGDRRGRLLGATVAAPAGGEAIAELTAALARGARIDEISQTIHAYPTLAEGPSRAADEHVRAKYFNDRVRCALRPLLWLLRTVEGPR